MSLAGYLFGNVDEQGRLDADLDDELKETLSKVDSGVFNKIFNADSLGLNEDATRGDSDADSPPPTTSEEQSSQQHAADAVDYSDFTEAVPDDPMFTNDRHYERGMGAMKKTASQLRRTSDDYDEDYDLDEQDVMVKNEEDVVSNQVFLNGSTRNDGFAMPAMPTVSTKKGASSQRKIEPVQPIVPPPPPPRQLSVQELYPGFEKGKILKFSELLGANRISRPPKLHVKGKKVLFADSYDFDTEADDRRIFVRPQRTEIGRMEVAKQRLAKAGFQFYELPDSEESDDDTWPLKEKRDQASDLSSLVPSDRQQALDTEKTYYSIMLDSWEDNIVWDSDDPITKDQPEDHLNVTSHLNYDLEDGDWISGIIWDDEKDNGTPVKLTLNLNDTNMLFDVAEVEATKPRISEPKYSRKNKRPAIKQAVVKPAPPTANTQAVDGEPARKITTSRFNLANDRYYDTNYTGKLVRVRQTFGQLVVQHSLPALKLQPPFYKSKLSKAELRSFHRNQIQFPLHTEITFSRIKARKKRKKDKKKEAAETMRTSKDLTLKDNTYFTLLEYSEEYPPIIPNIGMGSLFINYYRKRDNEDTHIPSAEIGEPFILDLSDTSPFFNFGNVDPGQTIPVLYNNLIRAPLFKHKVHETDFIVFRNTFRGQTKYYIREIPSIFTIGQTYPVQEVPGPHSRKVTTTIRNRLQVSAYRLIRKNPQHRLKMSKLAAKFPEYSDIQIRQRLKEFLEYHRRNKEGGGGYWKPKGGEPPSEEDLRKMVTPEMVCLHESTMVGERHLEDFGYSNVNEDDDGDGDSKLEVEQQLAPWFATRNFINATQGKAMLKLYGAGDPTGRGEGFSFIRVSMKGIFLRAGESAAEKLAEIEARPKSAHKYNVAEQQQIYKEEITRIWKAQFDALTNPVEPILSEQDMEEDNSDNEDFDSPGMMDLDDMRSSYKSSVPASPASFSIPRRAMSEMDDDEVSVAESMGSRTSFNPNAANKQLVIRRLIKQPNGDRVWQSETVTDPAVVKAYLRQRQMIEEEATSTETLEPTDDIEKNARMKKRIQDQLAKLKRNAERRRQRQLNKNAALAENPVFGLMRGKKEGAIRKCGNCGQLGHMKTNKNCPMFYKMNPEAGPPPPDHNGPNNPLAFRQPKSPTLGPKSAGPTTPGAQDAPSLTFKLPTKAFASTPAKRKFSDSDPSI
ncbi:hypothetical protein BC943DRAFT_360547 [Umbelopsis sp. AD052]|nr:hypothetical protein BC943DRAFT_360547 [Umbelopsis sp. AD052]